MLPFVSCVCPTYGRAPHYLHLLEEAVESFVRQDYPLDRRELLVLNDCAAQELTCDAPGVRVLNLSVRSPSLGGKYNQGIREAKGELLCTWEDDDISLPNRISLSVRRIGKADYFNPRAYWYLHSGGIVHEQNTGYAHNASLFTRAAWERVGGYPQVSGPQDAAMDGRLRALGRTVDGPLLPDESYYIYRWDVSDLHLSGQADTEKAYRDHGLKQVKAGRFVIHPRWLSDYEHLTGRKP
jgi:glycosyltransferase involved in cell wall biosynthesis